MYADLHVFEFAALLPDTKLGPGLDMPEKFSRAFRGCRPLHLEMLMEGSAASWMVSVLFDGAAHMALGEAWHDFAEAREVRPGYLLVFEFLGNGVLVRKIFDSNLCRKEVGTDSNDSDGSLLFGFSDGEDSD